MDQNSNPDIDTSEDVLHISDDDLADLNYLSCGKSIEPSKQLNIKTFFSSLQSQSSLENLESESSNNVSALFDG